MVNSWGVDASSGKAWAQSSSKAADYGDEFIGLNRFGYVSIEPGKYGPHAILNTRVGGESDCGDASLLPLFQLTYALNEFVSIDTGHSNVTDHQIELFLFE
jgi:hypothetical protein